MRTSLATHKEKAIALRKEGYSYGYIKKALDLKSKGTLSVWFKDLVLSTASKKKLEKNNELATKRGLSRFNTRRTEAIHIENKLSYRQGFSIIPKKLNKRELLLIGTALYWAEGTKAGGDKPSPKFSFSNSDPQMVLVFMRFVREVLEIDIDTVSGGIHLYPDTDVTKAVKFWSQLTHIPEKRFYVIAQVSRASQGLKRNTLPHGTLHIRINKRLVFYKMKGMIDGLIKSCIPVED